METRTCRGEMKRERDGWRRKRISYFVIRTCLNERLQWRWNLTKRSIDLECFIRLDVVARLERPLRCWLWNCTLKTIFTIWTQTLNSLLQGYLMRCLWSYQQEPQSFWQGTNDVGIKLHETIMTGRLFRLNANDLEDHKETAQNPHVHVLPLGITEAETLITQ